MEISKFISEALKDGSIDKVSKGIEQLVMMMINAIGMIEKREIEFEKRLETLEEDIDLIKSFLLSKPIPFPNSAQGSSKALSSPSQDQHPPAAEPHQPSHKPSRPLPSGRSSTIETPSPQVDDSQSTGDQTPLSEEPLTIPTGPREEDIIDFRKKILKPTPKREKVATPPVSIRAALMQEMKDYFGTAMDKVKNEKKGKKINPISK